MTKQKTPLELVAYFKSKQLEKKDGTEVTDASKRKMALDKAVEYKRQKAK